MKSSPSWSMRVRIYPSKLAVTPGPGEYDLRMSKDVRFYISASTRKDLSNQRTPGPGNYDLKHVKAGPNISFSRTGRAADKPEATPGPGEYSNDLAAVGPFYSFRGRDLKKGSSHVPGPGSYDLKFGASFQGFPSALIGKAERKDVYSKSFGPGPGSYDVLAKESRGPKWKIGSSVRKMFRKNDNPGPGNYNIRGEVSCRSVSPMRSVYKRKNVL